MGVYAAYPAKTPSAQRLKGGDEYSLFVSHNSGDDCAASVHDYAELSFDLC
jgi:hypothetical protein